MYCTVPYCNVNPCCNITAFLPPGDKQLVAAMLPEFGLSRRRQSAEVVQVLTLATV